jgi:hypothetical protein
MITLETPSGTTVSHYGAAVAVVVAAVVAVVVVAADVVAVAVAVVCRSSRFNKVHWGLLVPQLLCDKIPLCKPRTCNMTFRLGVRGRRGPDSNTTCSTAKPFRPTDCRIGGCHTSTRESRATFATTLTVTISASVVGYPSDARSFTDWLKHLQISVHR